MSKVHDYMEDEIKHAKSQARVVSLCLYLESIENTCDVRPLELWSMNYQLGQAFTEIGLNEAGQVCRNRAARHLERLWVGK